MRIERRERLPPAPLRSIGGGGAGCDRSWCRERLAGGAPVAPPRRIPARSLAGADARRWRSSTISFRKMSDDFAVKVSGCGESHVVLSLVSVENRVLGSRRASELDTS